MAAVGSVAAAGGGRGDASDFVRRKRRDDDLSDSSSSEESIPRTGNEGALRLKRVPVRTSDLQRVASDRLLKVNADMKKQGSLANLDMKKIGSSANIKATISPEKKQGSTADLKPPSAQNTPKGPSTENSVPNAKDSPQKVPKGSPHVSKDSPHQVPKDSPEEASESKGTRSRSRSSSSSTSAEHSQESKSLPSQRSAEGVTTEGSENAPEEVFIERHTDMEDTDTSQINELFEVASETDQEDSFFFTDSDEGTDDSEEMDWVTGEKKEQNLNWMQKVYSFLNDPLYSKASFFYSLFMFVIIVVSTCTFLVGTYPDFQEPYIDFSTGAPQPDKYVSLDIIEAIVLAIFSIDYVIRLVLTYDLRLFWFLSPMNLIDFVAIAPFFIELALESTGTNISALVVLRVLRLLRVMRILKLAKNNRQLPIATLAFKRSGPGFMVALFTMLITFIIFASAEYYAEISTAKFDESRLLWLYPDGSVVPFQSIPVTMWYIIVTMTTVGYGDMYPITIAGKIVGAVAMMAGVLVLAFPLTILTANFQIEFDKYNIKLMLNEEHRKLKLWIRDLDEDGNHREKTAEEIQKYGWLGSVDTTRPEPKLAKDMWRLMMNMRKRMEDAEDTLIEFADEFLAIEYSLRALEKRVMRRRKFQIKMETRRAGCLAGRCCGAC